MASVAAKTAGSRLKVIDDVNTVEDVREALNLSSDYSAVVNGDSADSDQSLKEDDVVIFSQKHKGAL